MAAAPPRRICLLRLSALGDCANVVPVVHTLRAARPDVELAWIIDRGQAALVADLPGVSVYSLDKRGGRRGAAELRRRLAGQRFDVLLHMHASWRANRISRLVDAPRRIGFDARRTRDGQRLFVSERIAPAASRHVTSAHVTSAHVPNGHVPNGHVPNGHVVDGFMAFATRLGASPVYDWRVPVADADRARAAALLGDDPRPVLLISPCSSHPRRNWPAGRYAAVADYAARVHGLRCVLVGGAGANERALGRAVTGAMAAPATDLIGRTRVKELLALFARARLLVAVDSGPAHMANAANLPVISLHAATDSRRSGCYRWRGLCVDYFAAAARRYRNTAPEKLKWGTRIEDDDGVMALIPVAAVTAQLDRAMALPIPATG